MVQDASPKAAPARSVLPWLLAYGIPATLLLLFSSDIRTLFVPLAGPFAARLYGHSCGMSDQAPGATAAMTLIGSCLVLARLKWRSGWLTALLLLWWVLWLAVAWISMINANS